MESGTDVVGREEEVAASPSSWMRVRACQVSCCSRLHGVRGTVQNAAGDLVYRTGCSTVALD